jgi:uncharacterized protein YndB with AHSA1/START domain
MNGEKPDREVRQEIHVEAAPETVFALLTDAKAMKTWLAEIVAADPRPGGLFRVAEPGGKVIEGTYIEVVPDAKVVFTWGGIEGLEPGQSTVEFLLEPDGEGTLVRLRHYGLPGPLIEEHDQGWQLGGLPKLKAVSEGRDPGGLCLGAMHGGASGP